MIITTEQEALQWIICFACGHDRVMQFDADKYPDITYMKKHGYLDCMTPNCPGQNKAFKYRNIIQKILLKQSSFEHGKYYYGKCRNARVARYNTETNRFIYMREKFGRVFPETIGHIENDDGFDIFEPCGEYLSPPFEIPLIN